MPTHKRGKYIARIASKKARDGRVLWSSYNLGNFPTWEEARITEIDAKIDALLYERNELLTVLLRSAIRSKDEALQRIADSVRGKLVREQVVAQQDRLLVSGKVTDNPSLAEPESLDL